ncbi:MAG: hypothetical protein EZS28_013426 [Streblomastix strix]|uniref:ISXO2-like transposase domain-containing protein n=1 Tax=Streblomastix strix TaxID=222440 RepID=A0A5J4W831_9EUKA|nr:MAG: hypothetical protein EZS28_013426 [Streblomastix strix]
MHIIYCERNYVRCPQCDELIHREQFELHVCRVIIPNNENSQSPPPSPNLLAVPNVDFPHPPPPALNIGEDFLLHPPPPAQVDEEDVNVLLPQPPNIEELELQEEQRQHQLFQYPLIGTIRQVHTQILTNNDALYYMRRIGMLQQHFTCNNNHQEREMSLRNKGIGNRGENIMMNRCPTCGQWSSVRGGSAFQGTKIGLLVLLIISFHFWMRHGIHETANETSVCEKTVGVLYRRFRLTMAEIISNEAGMIGGEGIEIEVDEALFGRMKNHRGAPRAERWVLGGIERIQRDGQPRRMFLEPVSDRSSETLCEVIRRRVLPGTIIITDMWRAYNRLNENGAHYTHLTVNHQVHFVDPETGANTQTIEGTWSHLRRQLPRFGGGLMGTFCNFRPPLADLGSKAPNNQIQPIPQPQNAQLNGPVQGLRILAQMLGVEQYFNPQPAPVQALNLPMAQLQQQAIEQAIVPAQIMIPPGRNLRDVLRNGVKKKKQRLEERGKKKKGNKKKKKHQ